ncbi:MAG: UDP-N-acetylmuramoyl-tripeptide--D-alanyl-D-alanine ligase [Deltaproteobacteria bacterium]|nr:UDP-N-acetylmuramoyl-tripeptide--D-alanyl-D-alanine ligase [Deltaproteobacteria bacterium]
MIRLTIKDVLNAVGGRLIQGDKNACINGVSTDSRNISNGELFFALKGPRFDGHSFVNDVLKKGAAGVIVQREEPAAKESEKGGKGEREIKIFSDSPILRFSDSNPQFGIVQVEDTLSALGNLARYWREMHPVPLIAVSGSCGKTTTKEMIAAILKTSRSIIKTQGNLNNLIGLPLTIFRLNNIHKAAVLELGISEKGEMKKLAQICKPDVAVLTNISEAHTATLGNVEGVASAKGELFQNMDTHGAAIINIDDPQLRNMAENIKMKKITFSLQSKADVMLKEVKSTGQGVRNSGGIAAAFLVMGKEIPVRLKYAGMHNLYNAASAIAATIPLGATKEEIIDGLYSTEPMHGRMEIVILENGITVIDDTYNANPLSMEASLKTLADMKGRKIAVLGDMLELGSIAIASHKNIGRLVHEMGIDMLFTIGDFSNNFMSGAIDAGMAADTIHKATDKSGLVEILNSIIKQGDNILVKGSRGMKMEEVVEKLQDTSCKLQVKK